MWDCRSLIRIRRFAPKGVEAGQPYRAPKWEAGKCGFVSGLQKGPAERGHVKNRRKVSKMFSTLFDIFRAWQKTSKIVKSVKNVFDNFRAAPVFRPLLGGPGFGTRAMDFRAPQAI